MFHFFVIILTRHPPNFWEYSTYIVFMAIDLRRNTSPEHGRSAPLKKEDVKKIGVLLVFDVSYLSNVSWNTLSR